MSKTFDRAIRKEDAKLTKVAQHHMDVVYFATVLALHDEGWGENRIGKFMDIAGEIFRECAGQDKSLIQMCEEETGIEFKNDEQKSWRDTPYLNADKWNEMKYDFMRKPEPYRAAWMIKMKQEMSKWMRAQIFSSVALALHRKENWGFKRISGLVGLIQEIAEYYADDSITMCKVVEDETGMRYVHTNAGELALLKKEAI